MGNLVLKALVVLTPILLLPSGFLFLGSPYDLKVVLLSARDTALTS